jgi:hypothetical protein
MEVSLMGDTIENIISIFDTLRPGNPYDAPIKLQWINEVEGYVHNELYRKQGVRGYLRQSGVKEYDLPEGIVFNNILKVFIDGEEIPPITASMINTVGYFEGSTASKFIIYPTPTVSDTTEEGLHVAYLRPFVKLTSNQNVTIEAPYDKIYIDYMIAKMDFYNKEYGDYNNDVDVFDMSYKEFATWWASRNPIERTEWKWSLQGQGTQTNLLSKIKTQ